jgi:proteasome accessory factor BC
VSHDADKLIRQLSLVAFLMAERRPLTARDVKGNVEGYSEMSDEAFARRFYSDRAELTALGVPLNSQRDEFTGEELYTLRSEHYFLSELDLADDELAALQTALYTLEGKFAYAEPLRLALQNLALGRPGFRHAPTDTAERVRVTAPDYSPELAARLSKLEAAI